MTKKIIFFIIFPLFLSLAQVSFVSQFSFRNSLPNAAFVYLIFLCFVFGSKRWLVLLSGAITGFIFDCFSSYFFGFYSLIFLTVLALAYYLLNILDKKKTVSFVFYLLSLLFAHQFVVSLAYFFIHRKIFLNLGGIIYNFLLAMMIYFIYVFFKKRFKN